MTEWLARKAARSIFHQGKLLGKAEDYVDRKHHQRQSSRKGSRRENSPSEFPNKKKGNTETQNLNLTFKFHSASRGNARRLPDDLCRRALPVVFPGRASLFRQISIKTTRQTPKAESDCHFFRGEACSRIRGDSACARTNLLAPRLRVPGLLSNEAVALYCTLLLPCIVRPPRTTPFFRNSGAGCIGECGATYRTRTLQP